ncbi:MAG: hypothetical protein KGJ13_07205 [Patescibacteria group bacterium]|nr:hypothetical protein [Patescibacteria group bacterium]
MQWSKFKEEGIYSELRFRDKAESILDHHNRLLYDLELDTRLRFRALERKARAGFFELPRWLQVNANPPSPPYGNIFSDEARLRDLLHQKPYDQDLLQRQYNSIPREIGEPRSIWNSLFGFDL